MSNLEEARGYFELEMFDDAWLAIEAMPLGRLNDADVLLLRFETLAHLGKWDAIEAMAREVARLHPYEERIVELAAEGVERLESLRSRGLHNQIEFPGRRLCHYSVSKRQGIRVMPICSLAML